MSILFLDMDGIIADFVTAVHKFHGREDCYVNSKNYGIFDIEKIWGISPDDFWKADSQEFWETVPKMHDADMIVDLVTKVFGEDKIAILTAPSNGPGCVPGKRAWIKRNFPQFQRRIIFANANVKRFMAGPDKYLIDDKDSNVAEFKAGGGNGILVPRAWNSKFGNRNGSVAEIRLQLNDELVMSHG